MKTKKFSVHNSSLGMTAPIMVLVAYFGASVVGLLPAVGSFAFLVPLILYNIEKESMMVKFSAMQSFLLSVISSGILLLLWAISFTLGVGSFMSGGFGLADGILAFASFVTVVLAILSWVVAVWAVLKAFSYEAVIFPVIGNMAIKICKMEDSNEPKTVEVKPEE